MAPHRDHGARAGVSFRGFGMSDLKAIMQSLSIFALIMMGAMLPSARADPCKNVTDIQNDWRSVSSNAKPDNCDRGVFEVGKWYAFKVKGNYSDVPTECIKNNKCGAEIAMRLELNQSLPKEGDIIEAFLCGSYNILGKYDCCVLRTPVRISVCSGVSVYQFPTPPIDRCSVAICAQDPDDPPIPRSVIARTGDVHDESSTTESATTTTGVDTTPGAVDTDASSTTPPANEASEAPTSGASDPLTNGASDPPTSGASDPPTSGASDPPTSATQDDPCNASSEATPDTTPSDVIVSDKSIDGSAPASTTESFTSPTPTDTTSPDTPTTAALENVSTTDAPGDGSTSDAQQETTFIVSHSSGITSGVLTESTSDPSVMSSEADTNNNAPPMDFQQTTTFEPSEATTESTDKTTDKISQRVESTDGDTTTTPPPLDTGDETSSVSPTSVSSDVVTSLDDNSTSHQGDGSWDSGDTVYVTTSQSSTTDVADDVATQSVSVVMTGGATQGAESTEETSSTDASSGDVSATTVAEVERTETSHADEHRHDEPLTTLTSYQSTSGSASSETSTAAGAITTTTTVASPTPTWTPTSPLLLPTAGRPSAPDIDDFILIERIRFVFRGNHSSIHFSSIVDNVLQGFLSHAVREYKSDAVKSWNYTLFPSSPPVLFDSMTTYVDVIIQHTAKEEIIKVFNELKLETYLLEQKNLSLIAKCRASAKCEIKQPQASTESVFERNAPVLVTLIIICSVCLVVLLVAASYYKFCRRGVYVAQEGEGTNLADRRRYFNVNPSPFTDEQIMKDEVTMEKGEKPEKVENSSCNGSDPARGDSNTWVIPLDDAPTTSPVISNEDTQL